MASRENRNEGFRIVFLQEGRMLTYAATSIRITTDKKTGEPRSLKVWLMPEKNGQGNDREDDAE